MSAAADPKPQPASFRAAFLHRTFVVIWTATVVSNVGSWMYSAASAWLMTTLTQDAVLIALVQAVSNLPVFLFALPAGALADVFDKRKFLLVLESLTTVFAAIFAVIVWLGLATPVNLLLFTLIISLFGALTTPAWQAVVPQLVPRKDLAAAVTANGVGINVSRAIGPAIGGAAIAGLGITSPFVVNAISNLGVIGSLIWWRPAKTTHSPLRSESIGGAMAAGLRYARNSPPLRATLIRAAGFFLFASAYWALLPLVAKTRLAGGAELYGVLLGAIGAGAVAGAFAMARLKARLGPDRLMAAGMLGTAATLVLYGFARDPVTAFLASVLAGISWIAVLATLTVSTQVSLPDWVRARGLALFTTVYFGGLTIGSVIWGKLATDYGLPAAHFVAAAGMVAAIALTWRWKLQGDEDAGDLMPSMHWPAPAPSEPIQDDRGPVLITVEYQVRPEDRAAFLEALQDLKLERRRDGAYRWGVYEDVANQGRIIETFLVASWIEHLRQHERVTNADLVIQSYARKFQLEGEPKVTHLIAAEP